MSVSPQRKLEIKDVIYDYLLDGNLDAHTNLDGATDTMYEMLSEYFKDDE